jgi:NAD(P)-dependent dehydrogenase (short-subunit alcohol dehydrogenase family)
VTAGYGIGDISPEAWRWVFDVNVMGTLHGVRTFLPHMQAHGEGGHFVNTASIAGLQSEMGFGAYGASKHAVVGMSEGLAMQAKPLGIGVTILCPSFVRTRISDSRRNWPARYGAAPQPKPESEAGQVARLMRSLVESGEDPSLVARRTIEAIERDDLYVFTGPGLFPTIEKRMAAITAAMHGASDLKQSS